jgi:hypothetical protein
MRLCEVRLVRRCAQGSGCFLMCGTGEIARSVTETGRGSASSRRVRLGLAGGVRAAGRFVACTHGVEDALPGGGLE